MKGLVTILFTIGVAMASHAQISYERYFSLSWDINAPLVNKSYAGDMSMKGFQIGFHQKINDHFFMGVDVNNATYRGYTPRKTYYSDGGAVTTDFYNYVYSYGAVMSGEYYFNPEKKIVPFAGLGVGANFNTYKTYYNIYSDTDSSWGILIRPQVGAILKMGSQGSWGILAAAHYDYSSAKSANFNYQNFSNIGFRLGIVLMDF